MKKTAKRKRDRQAKELDKRLRFQSLPYREHHKLLGQYPDGRYFAVHVTPDNEHFYFERNEDWSNVFYVDTPSRSWLKFLLSCLIR